MTFVAKKWSKLIDQKLHDTTRQIRIVNFRLSHKTTRITKTSKLSDRQQKLIPVLAKLTNGGRIALKRIVRAAIYCSLLQPVRGTEQLNSNMGFTCHTKQVKIKVKKWHQFWHTFQLTFSSELPPLEFSYWHLWMSEKLRSRKKSRAQKSKTKWSSKNFAWKKMHTFTIITSNFVPEQMKKIRLVINETKK